MAFSPGYKSWVGISTAAGAMTNVSAYVDNISNPQTSEQLDTTTFGTSNAKTFIYGLGDGDTITISGPFDSAIYNQLSAIKAAGSTVGYIVGPAGSVASSVKSSGSVNVANLTWNSGVGGRLEYSASLQVTGAVTNTTW